jgi:hypothetical protein
MIIIIMSDSYVRTVYVCAGCNGEQPFEVKVIPQIVNGKIGCWVTCTNCSRVQKVSDLIRRDIIIKHTTSN